eukprot:1561072-Karenia_brevis.AAC.1
MSVALNNSGNALMLQFSSMLEHRIKPIQTKLDSHDEQIQVLQWQLQKQQQELEAVKQQLCADVEKSIDADPAWDAPIDKSKLCIN